MRWAPGHEGNGTPSPWKRAGCQPSLLVAGLLVSGTSYRQWRRREEAIRRSAPLPHSAVPMFAAVVLTGIAATTIMAVVLLLW